MEEVKWIKLVVNTRNSKSMKQLKSLPEGEKMALLWYEIMQLAGEVNERGFYIMMMTSLYRRNVKR